MNESAPFLAYFVTLGSYFTSQCLNTLPGNLLQRAAEMVEPDRERCRQVNRDSGAGGGVRDSLSSSHSGPVRPIRRKPQGSGEKPEWNQESPESGHSP